MAEKVTFELEAKIGQAQSEIKKLKEEVESLNKKLSESGKKLKEETKKGERGFKRLRSAARATANGIKKIGTAIKATGIGLLITSIAAVGNALRSNQKAMDFFNTTLGFIQIAVNDFVKFVENNFGTVVDYFKQAFDNPIQSIKNLGSTIKTFLIDRFKQAIESLGLFAKAIGQFMTGNFTLAMETAKQAAVEMVDVVTGKDGGLETIKTKLNEITKATKEYVKENLELAKTQVDLKKNAEIAAALQEEALMKFRKQAEDQRQIRDDESRSVAERIKANNEIVKILEKQKKEQIAFAEEQVRAAEVALKGNEDNVELNVALIQARTNLLSVEEDINGQLSEQKSNLNGLRRETEELTQTRLQGENDVKALQDQFAAEQENSPLEKIRLEEEARENAFLRELQRLKEIRDAHAVGTQARADAEAQLLVLNEENRQADLRNEKIVNDTKLRMTQQIFNNIATVMGENSKAGKAAAAAAALINTFQGITAELATKTATPLGFALKISNIAATTAIGFKAVKDILKTTPSNASSGASVSTSRGGGQLAQTPQFNLVGSSGTNQLASAIGSQSQQPIKAYVVGSEVTTQQAMDRQISSTASLGDD